MAKLPNDDITTIFDLLRQLFEHIEEATATSFTIFEQFGETEETVLELTELDNIRERSNSSLSRLYTLLLRVVESQPTATQDTLNLLYRSIERAEGTNAASIASIQDIKRNWNLP